ncbi:MAG: phosphoribosylanthranilate isomerase [Candidatus Dadabacteria bacterium]|nr:phosphoribosylanthranilate isomerase [Candidatus Dadabacteria bacterium]NIQ14426.1 phosphoribosylanthranilate isomerase [Candidatus Dadabacteria bacterium]
MKIKICGITNLEDAQKAVELGVDMLGFIFVKNSPRYIDPDSARLIIRELPSRIKKVGVFVNENLEELTVIKKIAGFDIYQLHGDETPEYCSKIKDKYIKAIRVKSAEDLNALNMYDTNYFLFDNYVEDEYGGTGKTFNWDILSNSSLNEKFVILSGGLNSENISKAIQIVNPDAVDISSGVEERPGKKDYNKMKLFVEAVRNETEI